MGIRDIETVAYLGPPASYTHQAAKNAFPSFTSDQLVPASSIAEVFAAVQDGKVDHGVVPFENSTFGPVLATLDLFANVLKQKQSGTSQDSLAAHLRSYGDLSASHDIFVPVQHCLLGNLPLNAGHGSEHAKVVTDAQVDESNSQSNSLGKTQLPSLSHITLVQSHEQALGQCKNFLAQELPHATKREVSSTSRAAELAAEDRTGATVAISSELAAELYGLTVLRRSIQDREDNVTRFMVIGCGNAEDTFRVQPHGADQTPELDRHIRKDGQCKALIIFTVSHKSPGALAATLEIFKQANVNLTSINTRPSGLSAWHYFFFVEVEGGRGDIDHAFESMKCNTESQKLLGIWPKPESP